MTAGPPKAGARAPGLEIARLDAADLAAKAAVAGMLHREFGQTYGESLAEIEAYVAEIARSAWEHLFVARLEGAIIGTAALVENDDLPGFDHLHPWLASVVVLPQARRSGVASALVTAVVEAAEARGDTALYLYTLLPGFYRDRGFTVIDHAQLHGAQYRVMWRPLRRRWSTPEA